MIPILYEKTETSFTSNGICRLHDCLSVKVTEERNGVYECDFEYPVTGNHYDEIQLGRIIAVTHDDTGDIQPFDIVSFSKPINGIVTFHAVHISYRLNEIVLEPYMYVDWKSTWTISELKTYLNSLFSLQTAVYRFTFDLTASSSASRYMEICDEGIPMYWRSFLGGTEGSILDTFHGEFSFDKFKISLKPARGVQRDFTIRYGVNMTEYNDETDGTGTANGVIGYWKGQENGVDVVSYGKRLTNLPTFTGRNMWKIYDYSSKFSAKPDYTQLQNTAEADLRSEHGNLPAQTIQVSFVNLKDSDEYAQYQLLMQCQLCDTIKVIFPDYNTYANMKIVKVVYDVLRDQYESMELGELSTTLSQALGVSGGSSYSGSSGGGGSAVSISPTITASTGTLISRTAWQFGSVVFLTLVIRNTASVASGTNIFVGSISETAYRPKAVATGASYYDAHAISAQINTSGGIIVRNASPSAVTIGSSYSVAISFTYMID